MSVSRLLRCVMVPLAVFSIGVPEAFAQERGVIQGRVFLEGTRDPVEGAMVTADPPRFQPDGTLETLAVTVETDSDDDGRFTINWIRSGIWNVTISVEGFEDLTLRVEVTQGRSRVCTATQQQRCQEPVEFHMAQLKIEAVVKVDQALAGVEVSDAGREQAKTDLIAADAAYNAADYRTAIDGYEKLLTTWPQMTALHQDIGDAYRALSGFEDALAAYDRFLAAEPDNEVIERKIARTRLLMGDLDAAGDLASVGGDASPEDLYNLGEVAFQEGNVDAAAGWYEKSAAADPDWEPPVFKLGMVALNKGDIEGAKVLFQKVVDLAPDSPDGTQAAATLGALP
jgi:tetratricopeptide (TPR) repeat protein